MPDPSNIRISLLSTVSNLASTIKSKFSPNPYGNVSSFGREKPAKAYPTEPWAKSFKLAYVKKGILQL